MSYCGNCGTKIEDGYVFCPECGKNIYDCCDNNETTSENNSGNWKACPHCGSKMNVDAFYCLQCGEVFEDAKAKLEQEKQNMPREFAVYKNKWVAFFLCLFLGFWGIHKFYEEKTVMGIVYIFTIGLFGIGWFVDIILILMKPNPYVTKIIKEQ